VTLVFDLLTLGSMYVPACLTLYRCWLLSVAQSTDTQSQMRSEHRHTVTDATD